MVEYRMLSPLKFALDSSFSLPLYNNRALSGGDMTLLLSHVCISMCISSSSGGYK